MVESTKKKEKFENKMREIKIEKLVINCCVGESGDKFAADTMARIVAGLKNCHRHAGAAERESARKSGQAAADDFDGPGECHGRRMAIRR